ncbi:hypothetical protein ANCCEY_07479 [Ancylostoma ceylanicum]|uniref:Receptor ligand binding region domain-containing protein n=1 Tax=Ancylostoma ceylanicum TaxID=53326 RepID=A0A0D6M0N7_9BILA|nr:hypothetical protein ANCCEY_07479 [Ancylostoma ceylanicum]
MFDQCNEELAAGYTIQQLSQGVDVILGPTCNYPTVAAAVISSFYNKPLFTWGLSTSSEFDNVARFPTMGLLSVNSYRFVDKAFFSKIHSVDVQLIFSLGVALRAVLLAFNWTQFAFVYSNLKDEQTCEVMKNDLQNAIAQHGNITLNYIGRITSMDTPGIKKVLDNVSKRARIVVTCFAEGYGYKRALLLTALDAGYLTSEYLYIMADPNSNGFCGFLLHWACIVVFYLCRVQQSIETYLSPGDPPGQFGPIQTHQVTAVMKKLRMPF